ncbi:hypothetical protein H1O16_gp101 [Burkholderia phage BcepSaruman]|uniref:Uncharacterized protein n=1 Tax=Burkholderia phage BcepSaruman TaxID=2530032 RepID=A0A4D5ZC36_9CAUD|nr:hypothetical protein H1O16_gp101 [Burkholderia phage BcepSaruman]QBX06514.1 hypothetical protein BcepSaruman_101 [Burkholderia phage BcepSaruman]
MDLKEYNHVVGSAARDFAASGLEIGHFFPWAVLKMNRMYGLPVNREPTLNGLGESPVERITGFLKTLEEEMHEGREILAFLVFREWVKKKQKPTHEQLVALSEKVGVPGARISNLVALMQKAMQPTIALDANTVYEDPERLFHENVMQNIDEEALVMIADWLGDMNVYNRSEALKFGIPLEEVLHCIMGSNFTKLNPDGTVTKNEHGKVLKGPNFRAPEEHIRATLFGRKELQDEYIELHDRLEALSALTAPVLLSPTETLFEAEAEAAQQRVFETARDPEAHAAAAEARDQLHAHTQVVIPDDDVEVPEHYSSSDVFK